ncbi:heavy-metal-associated domain-containing protein [Brumimicrobium mesophilum]|uniref:heavy-metal-associated domain-containing protein n=1 Tax=Brumimicrobium mesophilum TaxID=392717 RepID=UPI000D13EE5C|nr:heavy-metal-associated domain-containing protein [Brumimicrobium mesophilum]
MKKGILLIVVFMTLITSCATTKNSEPTKLTAFIETNAECGQCKERIEGLMNFEKGIYYSNLNVESKILEVKYNSKKTSLDKIKKTISELGYNADDVKALDSAQKALPACCQPGGM